MKKNIILAVFSVFVVLTTSAQIKVNSNGNVGIGSVNSPYSKLSIGINGQMNSTASIGGPTGGLYIENSGRAATRYGMHVKSVLSNDTTSIGIYLTPSTPTVSNKEYYGIKSYGGCSTNANYGVWGGLYGVPTGRTTNGAGISGSSASIMWIRPEYSGCYAGYFNGDVRVTGDLYGTIYTPTSASMRELNSCSVYDEGDVSSKLINVQARQILLSDRVQNKVMKEVDKSDEIYEECDESDIPKIRITDVPVKHELDAYQLREVYPELVAEDANGNVNINYIEMVPLLLQYINELNAKIVKLEKTAYKQGEDVADSEFVQSKRNSTGITDVYGLNKSSLLAGAATVNINIPSSVRNASLCVYDAGGQLISKEGIANRGEASIYISSKGLGRGIYVYSVVADGKVIGTKRMIVK